MTTGKTIALTTWTFFDKVMCLLFNMLSRLVITFLPRSKCLLILWLQSPSTVILEPKKVKSVIISTVSPSTVNYVNLKLLNTYIIGIYKKILAEEEKNIWRNNGWKNFQIWWKTVKPNIQEAQWNSSKRNMKNTKRMHIITKLLNTR